MAETIGDIETILESAGQDDDDSFEEMVRKLVVESLFGQNVEVATRQATESIDRAKERMAEERANIEQVFGPGPLDPQQAARPPKFEAVKPSITAEQFVMRALAAEGATLHPQADDTIDVVRPGQAVERITFKPDVVEREATGIFMGNPPRLYLPGCPYFERLVQRWLQRSSHWVLDLSSELEALSLLACKAWCGGVPGAEFDSFVIKSSTRRARGGGLRAVGAEVDVLAVDRHDGLTAGAMLLILRIPVNKAGHGDLRFSPQSRMYGFAPGLSGRSSPRGNGTLLLRSACFTSNGRYRARTCDLQRVMPSRNHPRMPEFP